MRLGMRIIFSAVIFKLDEGSDRLRILMSPNKPYHIHPLSPAMRFFFEVEIGLAVCGLIGYVIYLKIKQWRSKRTNSKKNDATHSKYSRKRRRR
jgi:hypothetical protein